MTDPTCAACGGPITKSGPGRGTVVETEAFHTRCVLAGRVPISLLRRTKLELARATEMLANQRKHAQDAIDLLQKEQAKTLERATALRREVQAHNKTIADLEAQDLAVERATLLVQELQNENRRLSSELLLHSTLAGRQVAARVPVVEEKKAEVVDDGMDGTEKRYSMMELD